MEKEEKLFCVYKHTNIVNGKSYIGQTNDYNRRCRHHKSSKRKTRFSSAIQKYGWDGFSHEILEDGLTLEEANFWESFYIAEYDTMYPNGYNLRSGGENSIPCEDVKARMSEIAINGLTTEKLEHLAEIREKLKLHEVREKMSASAKKAMTEERRKKHSEHMKKLMTPERKAMHSEIAKKGMTEEKRAKLSKAAKKQWSSPEARAQQSERIKKTMTPERLEQISLQSTGRKPSIETIKKRSIAIKNSWTDERRARVSATWAKKREAKKAA